MIDKAIQGHGFGDGLRKGTKAHVDFHLKKLNAANDKKKYEHSLKNYAKAKHHYENNPYHLLANDKEHQKNLRAARKHTKKMAASMMSGEGFGDGFYHRSSKKYNDSDYSSKVNAHMTKMRSASPWLAHVKAFYEKHKSSGMTYSQALKEAAKSYKK
jgi:hypothetical protein